MSSDNGELSMLLDVVISTRNNISTKHFSLFYVIRSLLHQQPLNLNITIADNGSTDDTSAILRSTFGQKIGLIDTSARSGNISASRNMAAACGNSKYIVFLDDDMILNGPDTLTKSLTIASAVDFACGARRLWAPYNWPQLTRPDDPINKVLSTLRHTSREPLTMNRVSGKNILDNRTYLANFGIISRDVFSNMRGFDEDYTGWGYQDTDLMYRLCVHKFEYALFCNSGIEVFHLSHLVDKGAAYHINRDRFLEKQRREGRLFNTNHFFEIYENDGYSLFSDFPKERIS
jgi:glycosyltransferase involved in cell wall biosynthesis